MHRLFRSFYLLVHVAPFLASAMASAHALDSGEDDLVEDFRALASMRPRACAQQEAAPAVAGWQSLPAQCAWRGLLRLDRWTVQAAPEGGCIGPAALWWAAARRIVRPGSFGAWQANWTSQIVRDDSGAVKRLGVIRRNPDGSWTASVWRWSPSERAATRIWQQGRWAALAAQAGQLAQASSIPAASPAAPLFQAWEQYLVNLPSEIRNQVGYWPLGGRCMVLDLVGIADSRFQLPYLLADSRLEQRAAMQLQLARRHPGAQWLRTFRVLPTDQDAQHERASYIALWREPGWVRGQLWLPTRGNGPVLRLRLSTAAAAQAEAGADVIEGELAQLARRWRKAHD